MPHLFAGCPTPLMPLPMLHPFFCSSMRFFHSVVVSLDVRSRYRRIVLRCICIHKSSLHSFRYSTCIPSLHWVLFLPVLLVLFLPGYWLAARHLYFLLASPSRLASCPLTSRPPCAARQHLLVSSVIVFPPVYYFVSLHPAKGFALQAPEYILFALFPATSL